jgi:hypothetical protein
VTTALRLTLALLAGLAAGVLLADGVSLGGLGLVLAGAVLGVPAGLELAYWLAGRP